MREGHSSIEGSEKLLGGRIVVEADADEDDEDVAGNSASSLLVGEKSRADTEN